MIRTDKYIKKLQYPNCNYKQLKVNGLICGNGNHQLSLKCKHCNTTITTNLISNTSDWIVHKTVENKKLNRIKLWNQA